MNGKKWNAKIYDINKNVISELKNGNGFIIVFGFNGTLDFEGEYLNGLKNGKCKEYYDSSHIKSEGEYLNGQINGTYREYDYQGNLIFKGEFLNGKKLK